ncbi:MAG: hypothetical protein K6B46_04420 [Opitutales bacterium]|nr:hypothetical protein [Opitutales bacterium]
MKMILSVLRSFIAFLFFLIVVDVAIYFFLPKLGFAVVKTDVDGNIPVVNSLALDGNIRAGGIDADRAIVINPNTVSVYIRFSQSVNEELILKGYDRSGLEIARARQKVVGSADDAANVEFAFAPAMSLEQARSFQLSIATGNFVPVNEDVSESVPAENPAEEPVVVEEKQ